MVNVILLDGEDISSCLLITNLSGRTAFQEAKMLKTGNAMLEALSRGGDGLLPNLLGLALLERCIQTPLNSARHKLLLRDA